MAKRSDLLTLTILWVMKIDCGADGIIERLRRRYGAWDFWQMGTRGVDPGRNIALRWSFDCRGGTGYQPVLSGNLPDSSCVQAKQPVGRLPTGTGKLPVPPGRRPGSATRGMVE
jgi:hypothetical protein